MNTYALLEGEQVVLRQGVCLGDDRDQVDAGTQTLHDLNVQGLETASFLSSTCRQTTLPALTYVLSGG